MQLTAIHDVNRSGLGQQDVEPLDVVQFAVGEGNEARNVAAHVEQRMPLQRCLGGAKRGSWKDRQAQIDRRGIRCVSGILPLESEALAKVALSGLRHQALSEFGMDVPVSGFVGIDPKGYQGPRGALDLLAESPGVALGRLRPEAELDVTKTLAVGQLCEGPHPQWLGAGQRLHAAVAVVIIDAAREGLSGQKVHALSENRLAKMPRSLRRNNSRKTAR